MKIRKSIFFTVISVALTGTPVMAATSISSSFTGATLDAGLGNTFTASGTTLTLSGTAAFTGGGGNDRSYVGTTGTDYATSTNDWTATIEVTTTGMANEQLYFGLGTGTTGTNTGDNPYGTPQGATAGEAAAFIYMYQPGQSRSLTTIRKDSEAGYWSGQADITDTAFDSIVGTSGGVAADSFYRYSMAYDATANTLTFDVVQISAFGGTVTSTGTANAAVMSLTDLGYNSSNGKIFFGGNTNTFDNLDVDVTATWSNTGGGTWGTAGNWNDSLVGDGSGRTASFNKLNISADTTVNLDTARTIGKLVFGDTDTSSAAGWTLANNGNSSNILTLAGGTPTITVNALGGTKTATISAEVAGTQGLTKAGVGTLTLSGTNTYTGTTTISAGTLQLGDGGTTGSLSTSSAIINNSNLTINRSNAVVQGTDFSGSAITGSGSLTKAGAGTLTLNAANSYSGITTIKAGTLLATNSAALGAGGFNGATQTYIEDGATLALQGGISVDEHFHVWGSGVGGLGAVRSLSGNNALTTSYLGGAGYSLRSSATIGVDADTLSITGFYQEDGSYGLTKVGAGTLSLTTASTYTGGTTISEGTLLVNGSTASGSAVTVASGATLGGSGTVGGATTIASGGHLAVGTSTGTGTQTFSSTLAFTSGSIFDWELNAATTDPGANTANSGAYDKVVANGDVTGTSVFTIALGTNAFTDAFWNTNKSWSDIFTGTGTFDLSTLFTNFGGTGVASSGLVTGQGQFSFTSNTLNWTAVPEPTSALAGLLITAGLLRRRRK